MSAYPLLEIFNYIYIHIYIFFSKRRQNKTKQNTSLLHVSFKCTMSKHIILVGRGRDPSGGRDEIVKNSWFISKKCRQSWGVGKEGLKGKAQ